MTMTYDTETLKSLLNSSAIRVTKYFTYPTGTVGTSYLFEQDRFDEHEGPIAKLFTEAFQAAAKALGLRMSHPNFPPDNKVAVELEVPELKRPVYLSWYDGRLAICYRLDTTRGGSTIVLENPVPLLPWDETAAHAK